MTFPAPWCSRMFQAAVCGLLMAGLSPATEAATKQGGEMPAATTTSARARKARSARLRLWKASSLPAGGTLRVRLLRGEVKPAKDGLTLSENANRYEISEYREVPAGTANLEVTTLPEGKRTLLPVYLPADGSGTLLVQAQNGEVHAEFFDDYSAVAGNTRSLHVYNLLLGTKSDVQVSAGDAGSAHLLSPGGSLRLSGIRPGIYPLAASGTDGDGKSFRWNGETDLRKVRRSTLLICPDIYGRMRPRLIEDGGSDPDTPSKAGG